jgi:hypothetical protein
VVLAGTGTAGAYHAGVLRALREAGVRHDVVAGRGVGAASALFAAVDADARLWDEQGLWTHVEQPQRLYRWRLPWRLLTWGAGAAGAAMALPLVLALALALAYPLIYLLLLVAPTAGAAAAARYAAAVGWLLSPPVLLGLVPRAVLAALIVAAAGVVLAAGRALWRRRAGGRAWGALAWDALGAPLDVAPVVAWITGGFWRYLRGAANVPEPAPRDLSQRYADLLGENVGQPHYRELILTVHDLDARADLVFALLAPAHRAGFFEAAATDARRAREVLDLGGGSSGHLVDALTGALAVPVACEPAPIHFAPESGWRGETHRLADRPAALGRLLEEALRAGVRQVIVVSADAPGGGPHTLARRPAYPRARLGEALAAAEAAAVRDVLATHAFHFDGCFLVRPEHNPLGPFDFDGAHDARSDRRVHVAELVARGYEDAYRQFLDPIVGESGEELSAP